MTPANWNDPQLVPREPETQTGSVLRPIAWASVPVLSVGFLSFVPFLAYAIIQRRRRDWADQLGMTPHEVSEVMSARSQLGRFENADELCAYTDLPPDRVDELRDLMIFS